MDTKVGLATASLVLGIIALVVFCMPVIALVLGIIGLVLGIAYLNNNEIKSVKGRAISGIVLSIIAILLSLVFAFGLYWYTKDKMKDFDYNENPFENYFLSDLDTNFDDIDSLMTDTASYNNVDNVSTDPNNGPGNPPE